MPIIPCAIVGAEEIYPMIGKFRPVARLLRLPYFPVTPLFPWLGPVGAIPLPSNWIIEFCPPVPTDSATGPSWRHHPDRLVPSGGPGAGHHSAQAGRAPGERGPAFS